MYFTGFRSQTASAGKEGHRMKLTADLLKIAEPGKACEQIEAFIANKVTELGRDGVILGLSGGIDSSLVAYLSARAVGPHKVTGLYMPDKDSEERSGQDAKQVADELEIGFKVVELTPILTEMGIYKWLPTTLLGSKKLAGLAFRSGYRLMMRLGRDEFEERLGGGDSTLTRRAKAYTGAKHRLRMVILQNQAELENLLVVGAANRSEVLTGLFVKFGCDHVADVMLLSSLYKTQVRSLAEYVGVPQNIIDKPPMPDLVPGLKDKDLVGDYRILDLILVGLEKGSPKEISSQLGLSLREVERIQRYIRKSRHMRAGPAIPSLKP